MEKRAIKDHPARKGPLDLKEWRVKLFTFIITIEYLFTNKTQGLEGPEGPKVCVHINYDAQISLNFQFSGIRRPKR